MTDLYDAYFEAKADIRIWLSGWSENLVYYELKTAPYGPDGTGNRARDNWLPLQKIAVFASGDCIEKANAAIQQLKIRPTADRAEITVSGLWFD